jgi:hypothetical protein
MFKVELAISLYYVPPMDEHGRGICLTRTFELPFVPTTGLIVADGGLADHEDHEGFKLNGVTWDMDRQLFTAKTSLVSMNFPVAFIADELRTWVERGWRLASLEASDEASCEPEADEETNATLTLDEEEEAEKWPSMKPRSRPAEFNELFRALIREMAGLYNNWPSAYAMDQTKMLFSETELRENRTAEKDRFRETQFEFERMPIHQQIAWQQKVIRKYPRLDRIVAGS